MTRRGSRLVWIFLIGVVLVIATSLVLFALRDTVAFAVSPAEIRSGDYRLGQRFRLFGLVDSGSIVHGDNLTVTFSVSLDGETMKVRYESDFLPDTFREGQGVIAEGFLDSPNLFLADRVLARHDETYIPREFADRLKDEGVWRGGE